MTELSVDPRIIGQRIAAARVGRGLTQQEAARQLGCSRPTYIAIEKGERPAKAEEIVRLAALFGRTINELLRPGEPVAEFEPHLRAVAERLEAAGDELVTAIDEFQRLVDDYAELERIMGASLQYNYPNEVRLWRGVNLSGLAEDMAGAERKRLGLGDQPLYNLRETLEWDVGCRIFYGSLPSPIAGMFVYLADLGCCILINAKHPPERRRASLAHEYAHLIVDRYKAAVDPLSHSGRRPANERFAESFAVALLVPTSRVRRRFHEIVTTTGDFTWADLCRLANFYFVSVEAMTLRLEELGLIRKGSWRQLRESRFKVRKAQEMLALPSRPESKELYPNRYKFLAVQAYVQEKISEGQLARFLRCDRLSARVLVEECITTDGVNREGERQSAQLPFEQSLLH